MDLKWLEDFISLAHSKNFSTSARERNVTQSAFSRRIAALEAWLGTRLIDRAKNPVVLTQDGSRFLETAETVVHLLRAKRDELRMERDAQVPVVGIVALHTLALGFFPRWFKEVSHRAGRFESHVLADGLNACLEVFRGGTYDFMLVLHHEHVPIALTVADFPHAVIGHDCLTAVQAGSGSRRDELPLLTYPAESFFGKMTNFAQQRRPVTNQSTGHTNDSAIALKSMVLAGHGYAWLPRSLMEEEIASGALSVVEAEVPLETRLYRNIRRRNDATDAIWKEAQRC